MWSEALAVCGPVWTEAPVVCGLVWTEARAVCGPVWMERGPYGLCEVPTCLEASECGTLLKADTAVWGTLPAALYLDPDGLPHHGRGARVRDPSAPHCGLGHAAPTAGQGRL